MNTKIKKRLQTVLEYLLAATVVLQGNSQYVYMTDNSFFILAFGALSLAILVLNLKTLTAKKIAFTAGVGVFLAFWYGIWILHFETERIHCLLTYIIPILIFIALFATDVLPLKEFLDAYANVVLVLAIVSLPFWLFGQIFRILPFTHETITAWGNYKIQSFANIHFVSQTWDRNTGIFTEAPMFVYHLCLALLWKLWHKKSFKTSAVLSAALLSCNSTIAVIVGATLWIWWLIQRAYLNRKKDSKLLITIAKCAALALLWAAVCIGAIWLKKISSAKAEESYQYGNSYATREEHVRFSIDQFKENPVWGSGFNSIVASSTGLGLMLVEQGAWVTGLWMAAFGLCGIMALRRRQSEYFMLAGTEVVLMITVSLNTGLITYAMFTGMLVWGLKEIVTEKWGGNLLNGKAADDRNTGV